MCSKYKERTIWLALTSFIVIGIWVIPVCFAADNEDTEVEDISIPQIKAIPGMKSGGGRDFIKEVEKHYDFIGTVDDVQSEGIVIGDSFFKRAPGANISGGGVGGRVGLILNKEGEIVLCEPVKKISK